MSDESISSTGDTLLGTSGDDFIDASGESQGLVIAALAGNDTVIGTEFDDNIRDFDGNDSIVAGGGDDLIEAGSGIDTVTGGTGSDTYVFGGRDDFYEDYLDGVFLTITDFELDTDSLSLRRYREDGRSLVLSSLDDLYGLDDEEYMTVSQTAAGLLIIYDDGLGTMTVFLEGVDPATYPQTINGTEEADVIDRSAAGGAQIVFALEGSDTVTGSDFDDDISLGQGDDIAEGAKGSDSLLGEQGDDLIYGGNGRDTIKGGAGDDSIFGDNGQDSLWGGAGNDELDGGSGNNTLWGGDGDDTLIGDSNADSMRGGDGKDLLDSGKGADWLDGGGQADIIHAGGGNDTVFGGTGRDDVQLGGGNDLYTDVNQDGSNGRDTVSGGAGDDTISTGGGKDELVGGSGNDELTGGADADLFVFNAGFNTDVVTDFEDGLDKLDFSGNDDANSFADLTIFTDPSGALISVNGTSDLIFLAGIDVANVDENDFIFT